MPRNPNWPDGAWSHSRFATLRKCPRSHRLKYVDHVYPAGPASEALQTGSFFHDTLEKVGEAYLNGDVSPDSPQVFVDDVYDNALAYAKGNCRNSDALITGSRLVAAYRNRYGDALAGWSGYELRGVETVLKARELHADIGGYAAIADVHLGDMQTGKHILVETKTAGRMPFGSSTPEERAYRSLRLRSQLLSLAYCGRDEFGAIPDVVYNLITKTKATNFWRPERISFTSSELDAWADNQRALEALIPLDCQNLDACDGPTTTWPCDYLNYCFPNKNDDGGGTAVLYQIGVKR
jgi:hypothetical protein